MSKRYFEDISVGESHECGIYHVTQEDIVTFGEQYDPQPYHVNEKAGEEMVGGLIASAVHTLAIAQRMATLDFFSEVVTKAGAGFDSIDCTRPVGPGDALSVRVEVADKRPLQSLPDRGLVQCNYVVENQDDEVVMVAEALPFFERRDPGDIATANLETTDISVQETTDIDADDE